jgi:hypothetical protein
MIMKNSVDARQSCTQTVLQTHGLCEETVVQKRNQVRRPPGAPEFSLLDNVTIPPNFTYDQ